MKVKSSELIDAALDWAVGVAEGRQPGAYKGVVRATAHPDCPDSAPMFGPELNYSTDWAQGGPIIEREGIGHYKANSSKVWAHPYGGEYNAEGPTALIAAMRCYVISKLGEEIEIPEALKG